MRPHPQHADVLIDDAGIARPRWAVSNEELQHYFDTEWGKPVRDEQGLFERLSLEGFQAGLSWLTVLRKRAAFREAFDQFNPEAVAKYTEHDVERLMQNERIIRNRQKILSVVNNAQAILDLRPHGGIAQVIWSYSTNTVQPLDDNGNPQTQSKASAALAKELKQLGFSFVGPTTMFALMEAIGVVNTFPHRTALHLSPGEESR